MAGAPDADAEPSVATARNVVVDEDRVVLDSDSAEHPVGERLEPHGSLRAGMLRALAEAGERARAVNRSVRDTTTGRCWVVDAEVASRAPWRGRIRAVDASVVARAEREELIGKFVHMSRNVAFALQSVLEVIELDRPGPGAIDGYLRHLRDPVRRLTASTELLEAYLSPPEPSLAPTTLDVILEAVRKAVRSPCRAEVTPSVLRVGVLADAVALPRALVSMLESGAAEGLPELSLQEETVAGRGHVRIVVERERSEPMEDPATLWELSGGRAFERVRLFLARATIVAHGGHVDAGAGPRGRIWLAASLPLLG